MCSSLPLAQDTTATTSRRKALTRNNPTSVILRCAQRASKDAELCRSASARRPSRPVRRAPQVGIERIKRGPELGAIGVLLLQNLMPGALDHPMRAVRATAPQRPRSRRARRWCRRPAPPSAPAGRSATRSPASRNSLIVSNVASSQANRRRADGERRICARSARRCVRSARDRWSADCRESLFARERSTLLPGTSLHRRPARRSVFISIAGTTRTARPWANRSAAPPAPVRSNHRLSGMRRAQHDRAAHRVRQCKVWRRTIRQHHTLHEGLEVELIIREAFRVALDRIGELP